MRANSARLLAGVCGQSPESAIGGVRQLEREHMSKTASIQTPAKINLYLAVTGSRPDGYHEIATVFWPVHGLTDTVAVRIRDARNLSISCSCNRDDLPTDERNTCVRAARLFAENAGFCAAVDIHIEKHIPPAAGLGGGSANAAGVLLLLNRLTETGASMEALRRIAVRVGADVPFFLAPRPATARGVGEHITPIESPLPALPLTVVWPRFPVTARWAYARVDAEPPPPPAVDVNEFVHRLCTGDIRHIADATYNALEYALFAKFPLLHLVRDEIEQTGAACAHVSGSGPCMFALFPSVEAAAAAGRAIETAFEGAVHCLFAGAARG